MNAPSPSPDPRKTYRLMAGLAIAVSCLLGVAIFSLSKLESSPWTNGLRDPSIHSSFRKNLPQFEHRGGEKTLNPGQFEGKWTLLSFWSYSCPPCLVEMPSLDQLALTWQGSDFQVLTVNVDPKGDENLELARKFIADQGISLPTYFDPEGTLKTAFAITEYPRHFLVNPNKEIVWEATGAYRWDDTSARDQLLKMIGQPAPESEADPVE